MPKMVDIVVGGQYGSEGKGAVADALCRRYKYDMLVRVAGPKNKHKIIDARGVPRALRSVPAAGINNHKASLYIAPGSEVDLRVLADDLALYDAAGAPYRGRLYVHPQASVLMPDHQAMEASPEFGREGSTHKGIGACRAQRLMRKAPLAKDFALELIALGATIGEPDMDVGRAMIEGTQGYWLGTHAGMYPYCTSSDCRAIDFLAMSSIPFSDAQPWVVFRSYPIRIAGNSGPLLGETTWEGLGLQPEMTTVTKKVRRVGMFEPALAAEAIRANAIGPRRPKIAFTFADYLSFNMREQMNHIARLLPDHKVEYVGTGPNTGYWV